MKRKKEKKREKETDYGAVLNVIVGIIAVNDVNVSILVYWLHYREKKSKSDFDFLTYSRETWFSFSYEKVGISTE